MKLFVTGLLLCAVMAAKPASKPAKPPVKTHHHRGAVRLLGHGASKAGKAAKWVVY